MKFYRHCFSNTLAILALLASAAPLHAYVAYTVTDLGSPGGQISGGAAINASGLVVGTAYDESGDFHATLFSTAGNINLEAIS
jgi:hypothetical protein